LGGETTNAELRGCNRGRWRLAWGGGGERKGGEGGSGRAEIVGKRNLDDQTQQKGMSRPLALHLQKGKDEGNKNQKRLPNRQPLHLKAASPATGLGGGWGRGSGGGIVRPKNWPGKKTPLLPMLILKKVNKIRGKKNRLPLISGGGDSGGNPISHSKKNIGGGSQNQKPT